MMSDESFRVIVVAFIAGLPATIAALAGLLQSRKNGRGQAENTALTQATSDKVEEVAGVAGEIHTQTNGTLSELRTKLAAAEAENAALKTAARP